MRLASLPMVLLAAAALPAQEQPVFRAGVSLVRLDVQVIDRGPAISGLAQDDFEVFDEGQRQEIAYFGRESEPLSLLLLLDVSGSMRRHLEEMAGAARQALQKLLPEDRVAIMLFSRNTKVSQEFTSDFSAVAAEIGAAVREQGLGSGTRINASVIAAADYLRASDTERRGRRAILILTDNHSLGFRTPDETVIRSLLAADTVLNAIVVGDGRRPEPPRPGQYVNPDFTPADVYHLAEETGGEAVKANRAGAMFGEILERIRTRYSIHYRAPEAPAGTFRHVRVELAPAASKRYPKATLRFRSGYEARG